MKRSGIDIEVPNPSRYTRHERVDEIALVYNQAYRSMSGTAVGFPVEMEHFIDLLDLSILWDSVEEPQGAMFLASYSPEGNGLITVNERHRDLFDSRPDVYSYCLGHELGHCLLRHCEDALFGEVEGAPTLFQNTAQGLRLFHKASWNQYGMTKEEVLKRQALERQLVRTAGVNETARQTLQQLHNRYEPEWMFWQAEHFSLCLHIPKDRLQEQLQERWDFRRWSAIYGLAKRFGVSGSMMKTRLLKLNIIKITAEGQLQPVPAIKQGALFS